MAISRNGTCPALHHDISPRDVSGVTNMSAMFAGAKMFDGDKRKSGMWSSAITFAWAQVRYRDKRASQQALRRASQSRDRGTSELANRH